MKRILIGLSLSFGIVLGGVGCACSVEKGAVTQVEKSHEIISEQLLKYVNADPKLDAKAKNDWKGLVESDKRNIAALKKALEK